MTAVLEPRVIPEQRPAEVSPRQPLDVRRVVLSWALLALSATAAWLVLFALVLSGMQEQHAQRQGYAQLREELAQQTAPLGGVIKPGTPVALLSSDALGLHDVVVREGTAAGDLQNGPGHRRDTVLPGQVGASVVYGRAKLFGGPFHRLLAAKPGDTIEVITGQGRFTYRVERLRRPGDPLPVPPAAKGGRLTLVTAGGVGPGRLWAGGQPVYLDAALQGTGAPSPGVGVALAPKAETAMQADPSSFVLLVLWLSLLAAVCVLVVWAALRWGLVQSWLVGVPVLVLALWGASEAAVQLLPNLL